MTQITYFSLNATPTSYSTSAIAYVGPGPDGQRAFINEINGVRHDKRIVNQLHPAHTHSGRLAANGTRRGLVFCHTCRPTCRTQVAALDHTRDAGAGLPEFPLRPMKSR